MAGGDPIISLRLIPGGAGARVAGTVRKPGASAEAFTGPVVSEHGAWSGGYSPAGEAVFAAIASAWPVFGSRASRAGADSRPLARRGFVAVSSQRPSPPPLCSVISLGHVRCHGRAVRKGARIKEAPDTTPPRRKAPQGLAPGRTPGHAGHVDTWSVVNRHQARSSGWLAALANFGHGAQAASLRHPGAGVGVHLGVEHQDCWTSWPAPARGEAAVADVIGQPSAADHPDAAFDQSRRSRWGAWWGRWPPATAAAPHPLPLLENAAAHRCWCQPPAGLTRPREAGAVAAALAEITGAGRTDAETGPNRRMSSNRGVDGGGAALRLELPGRVWAGCAVDREQPVALATTMRSRTTGWRA